MKRRTKATLLSAFVFPGIGHFILKKRMHGTVLAATAFVSLYFLIANTVQKSLQVLEKIQSGEIQSDAASISQSVLDQTTGSETFLLRIATAALIISWLIGIIDSYRVGRAQDQ
jgi:hypothetical protein